MANERDLALTREGPVAAHESDTQGEVDLTWWRDPANLKLGVPPQQVAPDMLVFSDVS